MIPPSLILHCIELLPLNEKTNVLVGCFWRYNFGHFEANFAQFESFNHVGNLVKYIYIILHEWSFYIRLSDEPPTSFIDHI